MVPEVGTFLQCVAVYISMLQHFAACCSVLQCVTVCSGREVVPEGGTLLNTHTLQHVAVCCRLWQPVLQLGLLISKSHRLRCGASFFSVLRFGLQCVTESWNMLHCCGFLNNIILAPVFKSTHTNMDFNMYFAHKSNKKGKKWKYAANQKEHDRNTGNAPADNAYMAFNAATGLTSTEAVLQVINTHRHTRFSKHTKTQTILHKNTYSQKHIYTKTPMAKASRTE